MPESAALPPPVRTAPRRPAGGPLAQPVTLTFPFDRVGTATNVVVTITAIGEFTPKTAKNVGERLARFSAKALGLSMSEFLAVIEALSEAARLEKAHAEAQERIRVLLAGKPAESPAAVPV